MLAFGSSVAVATAKRKRSVSDDAILLHIMHQSTAGNPFYLRLGGRQPHLLCDPDLSRAHDVHWTKQLAGKQRASPVLEGGIVTGARLHFKQKEKYRLWNVKT